jgi:hypothetical protein
MSDDVSDERARIEADFNAKQHAISFKDAGELRRLAHSAASSVGWPKGFHALSTFVHERGWIKYLDVPRFVARIPPQEVHTIELLKRAHAMPLDALGAIPRPSWNTWIGFPFTDELLAAADVGAATEVSADRHADNDKKIPENPDVVKLITRISKASKKAKNSRVNKTEIAVDFCDGDKKKAASLLRQVRRFPHLLS